MKVIEISPPLVQCKLDTSKALIILVVNSQSAELHDYMGEEKGRAIGMPLPQFTDEAHKRLLEDKDQIIVGAIGPAETFHEIIDKRREAFNNLAGFMRSLAH